MKKEVKAQTSTEFLMTYGWVILVAIVALGALNIRSFLHALLGNVKPLH